MSTKYDVSSHFFNRGGGAVPLREHLHEIMMTRGDNTGARGGKDRLRIPPEEQIERIAAAVACTLELMVEKGLIKPLQALQAAGLSEIEASETKVTANL